MWTQKACPCWSSRGGELVVGKGNGNGGTSQCEVFRSPKERVQLQQKTKENTKMKRLIYEVVTTTAKVALGDGGRQARLLTEGGETTSSVTTTTKTTTTATTSIATSTPKIKKSQHNVGGLEFHAGRLDNVDRSTTKVGTQKGRVVIIAGPTAVGKSRVAIALAKQLGGEIISADSIQVYKGMNVGSAKTPLIEREGVPHHLLDIVPPTEGAEYSASRFFKDARAATELVLARNRVPIVVGGTCTYLRWYMNGKAGAPTAAIESEIRRLARRPGSWEIAVHMLAQAGDPVTAYSLPRNDWYRLHRALQGIMVSGQPRGALSKPYNCLLDHMDGSEWDYDYDFQCYFLYQHRAELYHWIDLRCEQMVADLQTGLLQEASWLLDLGLLPDTSSASRGIGYQEAMEFLVECRKAGGMTSEAKFLAFLSDFQHVSRSLVKKQLTWFRSEQHSDVKQFHWIDASQPMDKILEALRKEYWRRPGYSSELRGSDARKHASYKEGKILKYYEVKNRIFTSSAAVAPVLKWVKQTQGSFRRSLIRL